MRYVCILFSVHKCPLCRIEWMKAIQIDRITRCGRFLFLYFFLHIMDLRNIYTYIHTRSRCECALLAYGK